MGVTVNCFLSVNNPHKPVSCQTISNWIVSTIHMAYNDKKKLLKHIQPGL